GAGRLDQPAVEVGRAGRVGRHTGQRRAVADGGVEGRRARGVDGEHRRAVDGAVEGDVARGADAGRVERLGRVEVDGVVVRLRARGADVDRRRREHGEAGGVDGDARQPRGAADVVVEDGQAGRIHVEDRGAVNGAV